MGFCSEAEYEEFLRFCPLFEQALQNDGIMLVKYWLSVSDEEQERRFKKRLSDPRKRWKFSPIDLQARARWVDYAEAKDQMFAYTDTAESPWYVVEADDKRTARLNLISHLLSLVPYEHLDKAQARQAAPSPDRAPTCARRSAPSTWCPSATACAPTEPAPRRSAGPRARRGARSGGLLRSIFAAAAQPCLQGGERGRVGATRVGGQPRERVAHFVGAVVGFDLGRGERLFGTAFRGHPFAVRVRNQVAAVLCAARERAELLGGRPSGERGKRGVRRERALPHARGLLRVLGDERRCLRLRAARAAAREREREHDGRYGRERRDGKPASHGAPNSTAGGCPPIRLVGAARAAHRAPRRPPSRP